MEKVKEFLKSVTKLGIGMVSAIFAAVLILIIVLISIIIPSSGGMTTVSEASLKEVLEICEFSTLEYTYNSIVTVSDEKKEKYHVSYSGTVKMGVDFDGITIIKDQAEKKIIIELPPMKVTSVNVDDKSLDFIFIKDKYETETVYQEAYKNSVEDLRKKAEGNENLMNMARSNAIRSMEAFTKPMEAQLPKGYVIEYR